MRAQRTKCALCIPRAQLRISARSSAPAGRARACDRGIRRRRNSEPSPTAWRSSTVRMPFAARSEATDHPTTSGIGLPGIASASTRPVSAPLLGKVSRRSAATVGAMSALLAGAVSMKPDLKSGPASAMKLKVSARLNEPCMPWPWRSPVSATSTGHRTGSPQTVSKLRKLTTIAGRGVTAVPSSAISASVSVPGNRPSRLSTKMPLT